MKTTIHTYRYYLGDTEDAKAYAALCAKLQASGLRMLHMSGGDKHCGGDLDGKEITLETEHLFDNQWNTGPIDGMSDTGLRVFDWYEDANFQQPKVKAGHYLDITPEMSEARRNRYACGYCGHQEPAQKGLVFCDRCLDSPYLKESEIYLTRMQSVSLGHRARPPLTRRESARLVPAYRKAQIHGTTVRGIARAKKQREDIESKFARETANAKAEHDGMLWLLDHGVKIDNVIFYDHTGRFCFGWQSPVSPEVRSQLLDVISEFPFPYDIKCDDGKKLSGD